MSKVILFAAFIAFTGVTFAERKCSDTSKAVVDNYKHFQNAFKSEIKSILEGKPHNQTLFKNTLMERANSFLDAATKDCNYTQNKKDFSLFVDLIAFSVKNTTLLTILHNNNSFHKIELLKSNLTVCVTDQVKQFKNENRTQYGDLARKSKFHIDAVACVNVRTIQNCTVETLKKNECNPLMVEYVGSLFDYMHKIGKCDKINEQIQPSTSGAGNSFALYSTFAVNAVLLLI